MPSVIEILPKYRNDPCLKIFRKLFIDFYEYSYRSFEPNTQLHLPQGIGRRINQDAAQFFAKNGAKIIENDETIAIRYGYDPKDYVVE